MGRLVPECFAPHGKPKRRFASETAALAWRDEYLRPARHEPKKLAYQCPTCGNWHLGTPKKADT